MLPCFTNKSISPEGGEKDGGEGGGGFSGEAACGPLGIDVSTKDLQNTS